MFYWKNIVNFGNMQSSIDFLPERKQRDLYELVGLIRDEVKDVVMIILYGSYARNTYVELDIQRDYGGGKIQFMSDYDILVVTKRRLGSRESTVNSRIKDRFLRDKGEFQTYPQIINESISKFNNALSEGRYFYVDILAEGIMLYDSGECSPATPRELNFSEIKDMALEYYEENHDDAKTHFSHFELDYSNKNYIFCSFDLHQVTEKLLKAIPLVNILYGYNEHRLDFLIEKCKPYTLELAKVFPRDTDEEKRLFDLLQRAYIEARYNKKKFVVTKEDIDALIPKVERLRDIVDRVCRDRIAYYESQIEA